MTYFGGHMTFLCVIIRNLCSFAPLLLLAVSVSRFYKPHHKSIICFEFISEMLVRIPGNVPVGQWSVTVATWYGEKSMNESRHDMETFHATSNDPFYVLFNPFSESKECIC